MTEESVRPSATAPPSAGDYMGDEFRMSFGDHLDELRSSLIRGLVGVALGTIVCLAFGKHVLAVICYPLLIVQSANGLQPSLQLLAPTTAFVAYLKIGFLSGLIVTMPWILYQIWGFISSGLYAREQRFVKTLLPASIGLFAIGVLFLYFIVLPIVLQFFISFNKSFEVPDLSPTAFQRLLLPEGEAAPLQSDDAGHLKLRFLEDDPQDPQEGDTWINAKKRRLMVKTPGGIWSAPLEPGNTPAAMRSQFALDYYISFVLVLALAFGIAFETPIVVFFLSWSKLVPTAKMARGRRYVLFGVVVAAAMLTPPDVVSQLLLAGPMYLLFELGLITARVFERKTAT